MEALADCACRRHGPRDGQRVFTGVDETNGRYGEVSVETCGQCGRRWLHYFAEYEAFTASGRWILGLLPDESPFPLSPENAVPILNSLAWYFYGGSAFSLPPPGRRARGNAPADLMASPGEPVPEPSEREAL